jgi:hypothetical protein
MSRNLVAAHPGNRNREVHGYYSRSRALAPEAVELADALMGVPHIAETDRLAVEEVARLVVLIDRVDAALGDGVVEGRRGSARELLVVREKLSGRLERWLDRLALTPQGRATTARALAAGGLGEAIRRRIEEGRNGSAGA